VDALRWGLHPEALLLIGGLAGGYGIGVRDEVVPRWRLGCFAAGLMLLVMAFVTPLDWLAMHSLLSAHLLQNVILAEWAPLLLVLGIPPLLAARLARLPGARIVTHPLVTLPLWLLTYAAWHVPAAYDAALRHTSTLLDLEHLSYGVTGMLFWWPVVQAVPRTLTSAARAAYVLAAFMLASPLGILLSLLSRPVYDFYVQAPGVWGISDLADQQIAGVTMSVEQSVVFFAMCAYFVVRFLDEEEAREALRRETSQIA
jgi:putative membrane protein